MARVNPQKAQQKWQARMRAAATDMKEGIQAVTESPTQKAAAAVDKYAMGVQRAVADGSFVNGLNAVSLQDWKDAAINKGVNNMQSGVQNMTPRAVRNQTDAIAAAQSIGAEIRAMPNMTESDAENRMIQFVRRMREYKKNG